MSPVNIVLMGPPGSGKGTQAVQLAAALGCEHLSTGALLRAEITAGTPFGEAVAGVVAAGELIPDELVDELVLPRARAAAAAAGYLLDGYPRSLPQAKALLEAEIPPDRVIALDAPAPVLVDRILRRARVEGRADDTPEVIEHRLRVFAESTRPVLDLFAERGLLCTVAATGPPDTVASSILDQLPRKDRLR
ncbi:nucleoside monophosphate kinase [Pseudonocardia sp.]|uniref:nucleoside monophosphate kinase n=1 Tax=Pseudonocardia sp. TaxID=60912 RepID=UPI002D7EF859|nr:nucleoside monophosphate kinase [Pseudonocardia sp.]